MISGSDLFMPEYASARPSPAEAGLALQLVLPSLARDSIASASLGLAFACATKFPAIYAQA
jgi:hypothetical protein